MNLKDLMEIKLKNDPTCRFCLHNGFAGFSYGCPSNPKFIENDVALELLNEYHQLTGNNPIEIMDSELDTLMFEGVEDQLYIKAGFRMMGFNDPKKCLYGDNGLG
ncbi:MAG TPA: hypothetical protein PK419_09425 [Spirochaetota bacterium]|jgi:hypothetical protein|nr:hypothetical protein [Spirochaetota bacterium]HPW51790.1 hypothetical protein [Spirochaetota bacterium]HQA53064.1 hypothetical protein [Spirochaetota bacterium]